MTPVPSDAQRSEAARVTANNHPACTAVAPFYWELGDAAAARASGSVNRAGDATVYIADTGMALASATKWLFGAYVVQRRGVRLLPLDRRHPPLVRRARTAGDCWVGRRSVACGRLIRRAWVTGVAP